MNTQATHGKGATKLTENRFSPLLMEPLQESGTITETESVRQGHERKPYKLAVEMPFSDYLTSYHTILLINAINGLWRDGESQGIGNEVTVLPVIPLIIYKVFNLSAELNESLLVLPAYMPAKIIINFRRQLALVDLELIY